MEDPEIQVRKPEGGEMEELLLPETDVLRCIIESNKHRYVT